MTPRTPCWPTGRYNGASPVKAADDLAIEICTDLVRSFVARKVKSEKEV
jgi:hypothetical protein